MNASWKLVVSMVLLALYGTAIPLASIAEVKQATVKVSKSWNELPDHPLNKAGSNLSKEFPDRQWWEKFQDPNLNTYIAAAIQNNPTLNAALHKVTEARALTSQAISKELPSISFDPAAYRIALPNNSQDLLPVDNPLHVYTLPLNASYELDLWGKNLDGIRSARRQEEATELQSQAALTTITGEVASAYFNLLRMDALIRDQEENLRLLQRVAELKVSRHQAGLTAYDEVLRAWRDAAQVENELAAYKEQQGIFSHQLAILTGSPPASADQLERASLADLDLPLETEVGSPAELLLRRPDILAQEKILESARIDVRAARKAFLPTINLGVLGGFGALGFKKLWDWGNFFSVASASLSQPIFKGGKLKAELNYRKAKQKEQLETYRQTILTAMKDVEDGLSSLKSGYERMDSNQRQVALTRENLALVDSRYRQGLTPKLDRLQAESELIRYRQNVSQSKADTAIATVSLYKALGGGY